MQIPWTYEFSCYCLTAVSSPFLVMLIYWILVITHQININTNMQWLDAHQCILYKSYGFHGHAEESLRILEIVGPCLNWHPWSFMMPFWQVLEKKFSLLLVEISIRLISPIIQPFCQWKAISDTSYHCQLHHCVKKARTTRKYSTKKLQSCNEKHKMGAHNQFHFNWLFMPLHITCQFLSNIMSSTKITKKHETTKRNYLCHLQEMLQSLSTLCSLQNTINYNPKCSQIHKQYCLFR